MIVYVLLFSVSIISYLYCSPFLLSQLSIVVSHTKGSTGLLTLLSLCYCLDSLIVLTYYTALNWHSIYSSTFFVYDSLSRVSCLSWQSMRPLGSIPEGLF